MEQVSVLLQQLASQLGTTVTYLWTVLLKQAPIDATIKVTANIAIAIFGIVLYKLHIKFSREIKDGWTWYDEYGEGIKISMIVGVAVFAISVIIGLRLIPDIINGYFNPEYWALKQILNLKK